MGFSDIPPPTTSCLKRCRSDDPSSHATAELCSSTPPLKLRRPSSPISHLSLLHDLENSLNAVPASEPAPTCEDLVAQMINSLEQAIGDNGNGELIVSSRRLCGDPTLPGLDTLLTVADKVGIVPPEDVGAVRKLDVLPAVVPREVASSPGDMAVRKLDALWVMENEVASLPEEVLSAVMREAYEAAARAEACEQEDSASLGNVCKEGCAVVQKIDCVSEVELDGFGVVTPTCASQWNLFDELVAASSSSQLLDEFEDESFLSHLIENSELPLQDCYL